MGRYGVEWESREYAKWAGADRARVLVRHHGRAALDVFIIPEHEKPARTQRRVELEEAKSRKDHLRIFDHEMSFGARNSELAVVRTRDQRCSVSRAIPADLVESGCRPTVQHHIASR